jgi:diguanylate cyclase (GGDEF)-like protein
VGGERLSTLAYTDPLTGIANRRALSIEAVRALNLSQREGWPLVLLYLDLDNFKSVNDRFGHKAGDEVLQQVSARLQGCLRSADLLCRIGGDEFVLLLHDADVGEAIKICGRIILALESPLTFGSHSVQLKASIGGAIFPKDGADLETLLEKADKSMYAAKAKKTGFTFYSDVSSTKSNVSA